MNQQEFKMKYLVTFENKTKGYGTYQATCIIEGMDDIANRAIEWFKTAPGWKDSELPYPVANPIKITIEKFINGRRKNKED